MATPDHEVASLRQDWDKHTQGAPSRMEIETSVQSPAFTNSVGMRFASIPSGEFWMGVPDEKWEELEMEHPDVKRHKVRITRRFYISMFETTRSEFKSVMGYDANVDMVGEDEAVVATQDPSRYPVERVSWYEAKQFCDSLTAQANEGNAGRHYRLPTEAEWEYVCRSGESRPYHFVANREPDDKSGENAGKEAGVLPIQPVGSYSPNRFGVFDMRGNVWEWCSDWYAHGYYAVSPRDDPSGPSTGLFRVVRGSDWAYIGVGCRLARDPSPPWQKSSFLGFRVVCDLGGSLDNK